MNDNSTHNDGSHAPFLRGSKITSARHHELIATGKEKTSVKSLLLFAALLLSADALGSSAGPVTTVNASKPNGIAYEKAGAPNVLGVGPTYDVTQFGAAGTGYATTGSVNVSTNPNLMTAGSASGFATGQLYVIPGAGVSGANLLVTVTSVSGTSISFTPAAFTTVSGATIDDTLGIQAAFDACSAAAFIGKPQYAGLVEFPGNHSYLISSTLNAHNSCRVEGLVGSINFGGQQPPNILWNGPSYGATSRVTGFTVSLNVSSITLTNNPSSGDTVTVNGVVITFVSSGASANQVNIGANAAATASALCTRLNTYPSTSPIYIGEPFTNPSPGVVDFKYQSIGLNGATESVATSDPANIAVRAAYYSAANPSGGRNYPYKYVATISGANSYAVNNWVYLTGFDTTAGLSLNNLVSQVVATTGSTFTVAYPLYASNQVPAAGSYTDTGTATSVSVVLATDSFARYEQGFKDIATQGGGVGFYMGSRVDAGTHFENTWAEKASYFGFYFPSGGVNVDFDKGWRSDSSGIAAIYWRSGGGDNFSLANGQTFSGTAGHQGAGIMLDNQACNGAAGAIRMSLRNMAIEIGSSLAPGLGAITLYNCVSSSYPSQFLIDMDGVNVSPDLGTRGYYTPSIAMSPQNDTALNLSVMNSVLPSSKTDPRWVGIPSLIRQDAGLDTSSTGSSGFIPWMTFSPAFFSMASSLSTADKQNTPMTQGIGDFFYSQLYQYGIKASAFLSSDTAFAALSNGTTLYAGQILAPPEYWSGANGNRYALDVVRTTGTTGTPNSGNTTCSAPGKSNVATCTSATDLSVGQYISIAGGSSCKPIRRINAFKPGAVQVMSGSGPFSEVTNGALSFCVPVLGPEIQLPTKFSGTPTAEAWSPGDMELNSKATEYGVAAWVKIDSAKERKWAGVPLGNNSGQINSSQISGTTGSGNVVLATSPIVSGLTDTGTAKLNNVTIGGTCLGCSGSNLRTAHAFCAGRATSSSTLTLFGAGSATTSCTSIVGAEDVAQLLMTGSGTLSGLAVRCAHTGTNASSGVFSIWDLPSGTAMSGADSGVNTRVTVTYGTAKANTTVFDTTHTFAYAKGDLLRIQFTTQANETLGNCEVSFNY